MVVVVVAAVADRMLEYTLDVVKLDPGHKGWTLPLGLHLSYSTSTDKQKEKETGVPQRVITPESVSAWVGGAERRKLALVGV